MRKRIVQTVLALALLGGFATLSRPAAAQRASAVPQLDLNRYIGRWFVVSRIPDKAEKRCLSDNMILYALGGKPRSFQIGTFCTVKGGNPDDLNNTGKMDKRGSGELKLSHLVIFSTKYWVLATGPDYKWALVGNPNHKTLWVLSRAESLNPETGAEILRIAAAQGFDTAKLATVKRTVTQAALATK